MRSKTSFCNGPVFRKNFGRFAPAWCLYTVALLLTLYLMTNSGMEYWFCANIATSLGFMGVVNFGYGALVVMLLFGDLMVPRMCNAIHALPLRRETWYFTNILSGLFFNLIPTVIAAIPALVFSTWSTVENAWQIPLYWLLGANLEYLFFFSLAVFCMFLAGSRVGATVIYGILNFLAILAYYVAEIIYIPHLPGVVSQVEPFLYFNPVGKLVTMNLIRMDRIREFTHYNVDGSESYVMRGEFTLGEEWWYLWVIAAIGVFLMVLGLILYRRRKLERAGDLLATRHLEAPFLALYSILCGSILQLVYVAFLGYDAYGSTTLLWAGLVIGWFTGRMLLQRSTRVFSLKSFLGLAVLAAVMGGSLVINAMDPFGLTRWVPNVNEVKSATVYLSYMGQITLEDPRELDAVIALHSIAAEQQLKGEMVAANRPVETEVGDGIFVELGYTMADGAYKAREYTVLVDSEGGEILRTLFNRYDAIFSDYYDPDLSLELKTADDLLALRDTLTGVSLSGISLPLEQVTPDNLDALLRAILADCEAGTLVQHPAYHPEPVLTDEEGNSRLWDYSLYLENGKSKYALHLYVFADSENILAWLEENGMIEALQESPYF